MASKTVTLYINEDVIEKLEHFAAGTHRSKSGAAEVLMLHGIANYDIKAAAPRKMPVRKKPTAANTKVKKAAEVKVPRGLKPAGDAARPGPKPKPKTRAGRKPKAAAEAAKPAKRRGRPPKAAKPEAQEAA